MLLERWRKEGQFPLSFGKRGGESGIIQAAASQGQNTSANIAIIKNVYTLMALVRDFQPPTLLDQLPTIADVSASAHAIQPVPVLSNQLRMDGSSALLNA